jgi:DNA-binding NarL/FixJ family response regulator
MTVRVLLVDDQPLIRAGLTRILDPQPELEVVGECSDGDEVPEAVRRFAPDVIVMDVRMKRTSGIDALAELLAGPDHPPPVLVLTTFDDDETVAAALAAGAAGFILKDAPGEDLVRAVQAVGSGGAWLDAQVAGRVLAAYRAHAAPRVEQEARLDTLTERERDVLALVGRGRTNGEIAEDLCIGEATVKTHLGHILTKLDLRDRAAAIVFAFDHGIVVSGG